MIQVIQNAVRRSGKAVVSLLLGMVFAIGAITMPVIAAEPQLEPYVETGSNAEQKVSNRVDFLQNTLLPAIETLLDALNDYPDENATLIAGAVSLRQNINNSIDNANKALNASSMQLLGYSPKSVALDSVLSDSSTGFDSILNALKITFIGAVSDAIMAEYVNSYNSFTNGHTPLLNYSGLETAIGNANDVVKQWDAVMNLIKQFIGDSDNYLVTTAIATYDALTADLAAAINMFENQTASSKEEIDALTNSLNTKISLFKAASFAFGTTLDPIIGIANYINKLQNFTYTTPEDLKALIDEGIALIGGLADSAIGKLLMPALESFVQNTVYHLIAGQYDTLKQLVANEINKISDATLRAVIQKQLDTLDQEIAAKLLPELQKALGNLTIENLNKAYTQFTEIFNKITEIKDAIGGKLNGAMLEEYIQGWIKGLKNPAILGDSVISATEGLTAAFLYTFNYADELDALKDCINANNLKWYDLFAFKVIDAPDGVTISPDGKLTVSNTVAAGTYTFTIQYALACCPVLLHGEAVYLAEKQITLTVNEAPADILYGNIIISFTDNGTVVLTKSITMIELGTSHPLTEADLNAMLAGSGWKLAGSFATLSVLVNESEIRVPVEVVAVDPANKPDPKTELEPDTTRAMQSVTVISNSGSSNETVLPEQTPAGSLQPTPAPVAIEQISAPVAPVEENVTVTEEQTAQGLPSVAQPVAADNANPKENPKTSSQYTFEKVLYICLLLAAATFGFITIQIARKRKPGQR